MEKRPRLQNIKINVHTYFCYNPGVKLLHSLKLRRFRMFIIEDTCENRVN